MMTTNNNEKIYTAPDSNTVIKRAPWYDKSGQITEKPQQQLQQNAIDRPLTEQEEKRLRVYTTVPFAQDLVKSYSAFQNSFFISLFGGCSASIYKYYRMKKTAVVVPQGTSAIRATGLALSFMYASSALFLSSYLVLRYFERREEQRRQQMMSVMNPDTVKRV
jgi:hypothetical protein